MTANKGSSGWAHVSDVAGARAAGALSVAVTTGPASRADLLGAGADVVLDTLSEPPARYAELAAARQRVMVYVTRRRAGVEQLLVFDHRDQRGAGLQVPAGGLQPGESMTAAALREVAEETGVVGPGRPACARHAAASTARYRADAGRLTIDPALVASAAHGSVTTADGIPVAAKSAPR